MFGRDNPKIFVRGRGLRRATKVLACKISAHIRRSDGAGQVVLCDLSTSGIAAVITFTDYFGEPAR